MKYRIELTNGIPRYDLNEYAFGALEVKTFISECIPEGYKISKIVKITKDGRGYDVTNKYSV